MQPEKDSNIKVDNSERFSISKKLRNEGKSNDIFEIMLNSLTIEEIISLKLELIHKTVGSNIYGVPLWKSLTFIVKDALLRYSLAVNKSKKRTAQFLGLDNKIFFHLLIEYELREYFNEVWGKDPNTKSKCLNSKRGNNDADNS